MNWRLGMRMRMGMRGRLRIRLRLCLGGVHKLNIEALVGTATSIPRHQMRSSGTVVIYTNITDIISHDRT